MPVAPTALLAQGGGHVTGQLARGLPLTGTQGQADTPFGDLVIGHLWVIGRHEGQRFRRMTLGHAHANVPGDRQPVGLLIGQVTVRGPKGQGPGRVVAAQPAQGDGGDICQLVLWSGRTGAKALALGQAFRLGGGIHEQLGQRGLVGHVAHQVLGQGVLAVEQCFPDARPGDVFGEAPCGAPAVEQRITAVGLRAADCPQFGDAGHGCALIALAPVLQGQLAVQFGALAGGIVVLAQQAPFTFADQTQQPVVLQALGKGQIAVGDQEALDFLVRGGFHPLLQ